MICPKCGNEKEVLRALCRRDNKTKICSPCATEEGLFDWAMQQSFERGLLSKGDLQNVRHNEKRWLTGEPEASFLLREFPCEEE